MSDNWGSSAALGYLAGAVSGAQTAKAVNDFFSAMRERNTPTIDVNAVRAAAAQIDAHIARQDERIAQQNTCIEDLRREVRELREHSREVEAYRDKLWDWAQRAEAELKRRRAADGDRSQ